MKPLQKFLNLQKLPNLLCYIFQTCFYFDVERDYFRKALDKFAHFFVSPLLLKDCVDREIQAVDSGNITVLHNPITVHFLYKARCLGSIGMDHIISELCYKGTIL